MSREAHWQKVYREKSPEDVSWFQADPALSKKLIQQYAAPADSILDVGAGASLLVDQLIADRYSNISLLDISAEALAKTRMRLKEQKNVNYIVSDIQNFAPKHQYHLWHDRAVLHFLTTDSACTSYRAALDIGLKKGGYFIVGTFAVGGPEKCSGLEIRQYDLERMLTLFGAGYRLVEELSEEHLTPWGSQQNFAWFVLQKQL